MESGADTYEAHEIFALDYMAVLQREFGQYYTITVCPRSIDPFYIVS